VLHRDCGLCTPTQTRLEHERRHSADDYLARAVGPLGGECQQIGTINSDDRKQAASSPDPLSSRDPELSAESSNSPPESRLSLELIACDLAAPLPVPRLARARLGHRQSGHAWA